MEKMYGLPCQRPIGRCTEKSRKKTFASHLCFKIFPAAVVLSIFAAVVWGMASKLQQLLKEAWTEDRKGNLSAWSEAKAWALSEVWRETGTDRLSEKFWETQKWSEIFLTFS